MGMFGGSLAVLAGLFGLPLILAFIPATVASHKGRSFALWWLYGYVVFPIATIHAVLADDSALRWRCPVCSELILRQATLCRYCGTEVEPEERRPFVHEALEPTAAPDVHAFRLGRSTARVDDESLEVEDPDGHVRGWDLDHLKRVQLLRDGGP